jgi:hypothetical protein
MAWWEGLKINALATAKQLWEQTRPKSVAVADLQPNDNLTSADKTNPIVADIQ